ncbi:MAG: GntR family transcriptional regulator [Clostridia bacterium]
MENTFNNLKFTSDIPIFIQVNTFVKRKIVSGELVSGEELPSRRKLAVSLGINPNTVQKICKQLEEEKLIETVQGSKSYINATQSRIEELKKEIIEEEMKATLDKLKDTGVSFKDVIDIVTKLWED